MTTRKVHNKLYKFATGITNNRIFDLYLKYIGVTVLTTGTLVPVALVLGNDALADFLKKNKQTGGNILKNNLPIIDDPLIGNYLKLAGIASINITANTLIPLGILMLVYEMYIKKLNQAGGSLNKLVEKVWGNRVLDLFSKYQGIKLLTSSTLVPFALILGQKYLEKYMKGQRGGGIPKNLPFIDDPLLGNYLKIAGLSTITLTPSTLVPLGILAVIYNIYLE